MTSADLRSRLEKWTGEEFGAPLNPHEFRHLAATTIATDNPERVAGIAAVLGHASLASSEAHYNKAKQIDAGFQYQNVLAGLRRPTRSETFR